MFSFENSLLAMFGKKRMGLYHDAVVWYKKNKNINTLLDGKWPSGTLEKKGQLFEWCNLFVFLLPLCVVCPTARCVPCDRIMLRVHFVPTLAHSSDTEPRGYKVNVWPNNLIQKFYMGHLIRIFSQCLRKRGLCKWVAIFSWYGTKG